MTITHALHKLMNSKPTQKLLYFYTIVARLFHL